MNKGFNWLKDIFKPSTKTSQIRPAGNSNFYQVKPTDKSLADVSSQVGVPLPNLVEFNQNAKTLPPVGSYISLTPTGNVPSYVGANNNPALYPTSSFLSGSGAANQGVQQAQKPGGFPTNSFTNSLGQVNTAELVNSIQNSPVMPSSIPSAVLSQLSIGGQPVTPQTMTSLGYTLDQNTGTWKNGSAAQTQNNQPAYMQNVNYNGKIMPAWKAELQQKREAGVETRALSWKEQRQAQIRSKAASQRQARIEARLKAAQRVVTPEAGNAADTQSNTLELRLGSG